MTWSYADLKVADSALGIDDPAQAAAALNARTVTKTGQKFFWKDAKRLARESATGDWGRIVARSRLQPNLPPASLADAAILAAINAVESADDDVIDPSDPGSWQAWQSGLAALSAIGDLSANTITALNGLPTVVQLEWDPPPSDQDIIHARSL